MIWADLFLEPVLCLGSHHFGRTELGTLPMNRGECLCVRVLPPCPKLASTENFRM